MPADVLVGATTDYRDELMADMHFLAMLGDAPNIRDEADEAIVRAMFLEQCVSLPAAVFFDGAAAAKECVVGDLYVGSHQCKDHDPDDDPTPASVELWAFRTKRDGNGGDNDWLSWMFTTAEGDSWHIDYCPFCGLDLAPSITNDFGAPPSVDAVDPGGDPGTGT